MLPFSISIFWIDYSVTEEKEEVELNRWISEYQTL
jgi:hypothetical protein